MTDLVLRSAVLEGAAGFFVTGDWCDRCGDTNYDPASRECLTCAHPDDPCSRAYLDGLTDERT